MLEMQRKLLALEKEKAALEEKFNKSTVYREKKDVNKTVEVPTIDEDGEVIQEEVEVEVQKSVGPTTVETKKPKPTGKLSGVKAKRKTKK